MPLFQINFDLVPIKFHYFLWNAGTAPIVPFVPTLAKQLGFSTVTVGTIYTFLPIFGLLAKPFFGAISDRFKVQKLLFLSFIILTGSMFYGILYIPNVAMDNQVLLECGEGETFFKYCSDGAADVCLKQKILAEGNERNGTTHHCEITCQTQDSKFLEQLCESWHVPKFCSSSSSVEQEPPKFFNSLNSPGHFVSKKFDPSQEGKYDIHPTKVGRSIAPVTSVGATEVKFNADISAYHIVEVKTCLHFPIKHVHFNNENKTTSHLPMCKQALHVPTCSVSCNSNNIMSYLSYSQTGLSDVTNTYQFWLFFILLSLSWVGMAVVVSLGDTICFELLGNEPQKYGKQRLWGSIGWGTFSIIAGFLVDHFSSSSLNKNYTPVFYLMLAMLLFDLFVSSKIKNVQSSISPSIFKDVTKLFREARVLAFLLWCISVGVCTAMIWQYLFWFLEDLASAQGCDHSTWIKTLEGLVMTVQCFGGELPFFFLSGWFLRKLGHINTMTLVLLGFSLRFYLYSILTDPWAAVPIELLNGITFGLFWPTMASYANIIASPGTEATIQGLVGAVFEGVGVSLGSFLGGWVFDSYGGRVMFKIFSLLALVMCGVHIVSHYALKVKAQYGMSEDSAKDLNQRARYASPTEAIHMLEDVNT